MPLLDWLVVVGYLAIVAMIGFIASRRNDQGNAFFLAGRSIPSWAASFSVVATVLSAATFVGMPQQAYRGDLTYMVFKFAGLPALIVVGIFFLPAFYRSTHASIYGIIRDRYGPGAGAAAGASFLIGRLLASGARLFMAAIAVSWVLFGSAEPGPLALTITLVAIGTSLYAIAGGIRAIIWTDVMQAVVAALVGIVALIVLWNLVDRPLDEVVAMLQAGGETGRDKLRMFDTSPDPSKTFGVWSGLFGLPIFLVAAYAVDQDHVQRLLVCKTPKDGLRAGVLSNLIGWPIAFIFLAIGLLLWVETQVHGTVRVGADGDDRAIMVQFMLTELPLGIRGLMVAGLLAAAMSSLDSALNALAATTMNDLVQPWRKRHGRTILSERTSTLWSRGSMIVWALLLSAVAIGLAAWQIRSGKTLLEFALGVMTYAYAGLLGVFIVALFTRRGSGRSVITALVVGSMVILLTDRNVQSMLGFDAYVPSLALGWRLTLGAGLSAVIAAAPGPSTPKTDTILAQSRLSDHKTSTKGTHTS
jgi:SSS family solute:Na+ symporter